MEFFCQSSVTVVKNLFNSYATSRSSHPYFSGNNLNDIYAQTFSNMLLFVLYDSDTETKQRLQPDKVFIVTVTSIGKQQLFFTNVAWSLALALLSATGVSVLTSLSTA